ncbi:hypothetical protein AB4K01_20050 [Serratia fonticola]|uniref:hypothetical protein n=1 Tax=Serratia fonticola TaxID=47917 RepID=UPI0034C61D27
MTSEKNYDFLVIGGEHDGQVYSGQFRSTIALSCKLQPLARFYSKDEPAEITVAKEVEYQVIEHTTGWGGHYFIASNEDLRNVDVEAKIKESGISPIA